MCIRDRFSPHDLQVLLGNSIANLFFVSNIFIWKEYGGYFTGIAREAPLLHTWSLSVEEQFYVIWPLMLVILLKIRSRKILHTVGFALLLILVLLSQYFSIRYSTAAYYLLPTRFFELFIGAIIAILISSNNSFHLTRKTSTYGSIFASFLILYSVFLFDEKTIFPGYNALIPNENH